MYSVLLAIHNILRWLILIIAVVSVVRVWSGWLGKKDYTRMDRKLGMYFTMGLDGQILIGILLYFFFSPITRGALSDFNAAMRISDLRFFAIEHLGLMFLSAIFAHLGRYSIRKITIDPHKHRQLALWFSLALLCILFGTPWWRPLFPGL